MQESLINVILIDLRNPDDFNRGHFKGAINIPVSEILSKESIEIFDLAKTDFKKVVLFAEDVHLANGALMILMQIGYDNVSLFPSQNLRQGELYNNLVNDLKSQQYRAEKPLYNFSEIMISKNPDLINSKVNDKSPGQIIPLRRDKKSQPAGGC